MSDDAPGWTRRELAAGALFFAGAAPALARLGPSEVLALPRPTQHGGVALSAALASRRSVRRWAPGALRLGELAQLLWAAQGMSAPDGLRTAPSAGATYPLELDVAAGPVEGLAPGLYRYLPAPHALARRGEKDARSSLASAAGQLWLAEALAILVLSAVPRRTAVKYGARAERYVAIEVGHAAENVYLQSTALGLGTVIVGAFDDARVAVVLGLAAEERPLALMPIGRT